MKRLLLQLCVLAALALPVFSQATITVDQLVDFVRSSIKLKHDDRKVADYVKRFKLTNKLDPRTVENLEGEGAGPLTVKALRMLITESSELAAPPPPPVKPLVVGPPPPDSIEQKQILDEITNNALNYSKNLPNFLCMQVTRRYADQSGLENYRLLDTVAERLSFFEQHEDYKVISINGVPTENRNHEQLGGAISSGEFGSMLNEIFSPESETHFDWERWATLRGHRMYVFSFRVSQADSKYTILAEEVHRRVTVGYHGLVYADRDSKMVMRIVMQADDIPLDFPIQSASEDLNYDYAPISGQQFVLPLKGELHMRDSKYMVKNEIEFRGYNKFGTDSTIQFDQVPEPLPADKTQEQPVK